MKRSFSHRLPDNEFIYADFVRDLKNEYMQAVDSTTTLLKAGIEIEAPSAENFYLEKSQRLGARVVLDKTEKASFMCNIGTLMSVDDLLLTALCHTAFFANPTEDGTGSYELEYMESMGSNSHRYIDYSNLTRLGGNDQKHFISNRVPLPSMRLHQASLLSHVSTQWVLLHEVSHWLAGHCHIMQAGQLDEVENHLVDIAPMKSQDDTFSLNERKALELQADGIAIELLWHSLLCAETPNQFWRDYQQIEFPDIQEAVDLSLQPSRIRLLVIACGAAILLFERSRLVYKTKTDRSSFYPHPLTRLQNLFATCIRLIAHYSDALVDKPDGTVAISSKKSIENKEYMEQLLAGIGFGAADLAYLAQCLSVQDSLAKKDKAVLKEVSDFYANGGIFTPEIKSLLGKPSVSSEMLGQNKFAAEEYIQLLPLQSLLVEKLESYALIEL